MKRSSVYPAGVNKFLRWSPKDTSVSMGVVSSMLPSTSSANSVKVPPPLMKEPAPGFTLDSLPTDHYHLGSDVFATVADFKGFVKIHIRVYANVDGHFTPTKNGVTLTPFGWQTFAEKLRNFPLKDRHGTILVENELLMSTVYDSASDVYTYRLQRMYKKQDNTLQFFPSTTTISYGQMDLLRDLSISISNCVIDKLFDFLLPRAILREVNASPRNFGLQEGENLHSALIHLMKDYVEKNITDLFFVMPVQLILSISYPIPV